MLEVLSIIFTGGEVKKLSQKIPESVLVDITVDKISKKEAGTVLLDFTYAVDYEPKVALLRISGQAYCRDTAENLKKMEAEYKKTKLLPMEYGASAINMINANAGVNSIFLVRPFNMLPPFMPPVLAKQAPKPQKRKGKK